MPARGLTLAQVRKLPAAIDVPTAASALGISRSGLYEAIRTGSSPVKTVTMNRRIIVLTADLIDVLEGGDRAKAG